MNLWIRTLTMAVIVATAVIAASPAAAGSNIQFDGVASAPANGECDEIPAFFALQFDGDLVGCLYTTAFVPTQQTPSGIYQERGTERFVGCFADGSACGTFDTEYKITVKVAPDGSEIHGRCQHPITSGTGAFAGATGRFDMKDDVANGLFYYRGHVKLAADQGATLVSSGNGVALLSATC